MLSIVNFFGKIYMTFEEYIFSEYCYIMFLSDFLCISIR